MATSAAAANVAPADPGGPRTYRAAARQLLRNTLLDSAREELRRRSWAEVTMADVARAAGVSRQTLYKEFGSRDEFARALVMRDSDSFLVAVEGALREHLLLAECLVRLAISYATLPGGPAKMSATSVTTLLGPYLEGALADAG